MHRQQIRGSKYDRVSKYIFFKGVVRMAKFAVLKELAAYALRRHCTCGIAERERREIRHEIVFRLTN